MKDDSRSETGDIRALSVAGGLSGFPYCDDGIETPFTEVTRDISNRIRAVGVIAEVFEGGCQMAVLHKGGSFYNSVVAI